jgi:NAD(P)-dependent dehydrogenase (short-subunit alcohol dehydrogenase family)
VDGHEATFALNHLAYFLLTWELRDLLIGSAPARIVNVSSRAHRDGWLRFDDLMLAKSYSPWQAYAASKLANIVFTRELARRLEGTGVTANSLHPGFVATNFGHERTRFITWLLRLARPMMIGEAEGAATTLHLACAPAVDGVSGKYFAKSREDRPINSALDDGDAKRLWAASEQLLGLDPQAWPAR